MATSHYESFDVAIESDNAGGFRARLLNAPRGLGSAAPCRLPYSADELHHRLDALRGSLRAHPVAEHEDAYRELSRKASESTPSDPEPFLSDFGHLLFESLAPGPIGESLRDGLNRAEEKPEEGLRIRVVLDPNDPMMAPWCTLPWELLYRKDRKDFLGRNVRTPVVRYLVTTGSTRRLAPVETLRVLIVAPEPEDVSPLHSTREIQAVAKAWQRESRIDIQRLEKPTIEELRQTLRAEPFDVVHFIGHGDFDARTGHGQLYFESEFGQSMAVSGRVFADTLTTRSRIRLAVLNACESGQISGREGLDPSNPYAGVASALHTSGVPAVVAHQFRISDRAAIHFSRLFYRALARGESVESAATEGRFAIYQGSPRRWEWMTPALFLAAECPLLEPQPLVQASERPCAVDPIVMARAHLTRGRHRDAIESLETILQTDSQNPRVYFYLALAQLAGRRPRSLSFKAFDRIQDDLERARRLPQTPAQVDYLLALLVEDHVRWNGRVQRVRPEDLVAEAERRNRAHAEDLALILETVPTSENACRRAIEIRHAAEAHATASGGHTIREDS